MLRAFAKIDILIPQAFWETKSRRMIWVDYIIIGIIGLSALISLCAALCRKRSPGGLGSCILGGLDLFRDLAQHLDWFSLPSVRLGVALALLFLVTLMVGGAVTYLIRQLVRKTGLTSTDRLIGMLFAVREYCCNPADFLAGLTPLPEDPWWTSSKLIGFQGVGRLAENVVT